MTTYRTKLFIALVFLIGGFGFLYFFTGVFGATAINLTLKVNSDLDRGLITHYTFDGGNARNVFTDTGSLGNDAYMGADGSTFMATTTAAGEIGQALYLDGHNVSYADGSTQANMSAFTACLWINPESFTNADGDSSLELLGKGWEITLSPSTHKVRFWITRTTGTYPTVYTAHTISIGRWQHICGVYYGISAEPDIYFDGVKDSSSQVLGNGTAYDDSADPLRIGAAYNSGYSSNFPGKIDDVRIYNRALSADEVKRLYGLGGTTHINTAINTNPDLNRGLVGHWTFDGSLKNVVADSGSSGSDGYFAAGSKASSSMVAAGKIGQAISLDGSSDGVDLGTPAGLDLNIPLTVSAWVKFRSLFTNGSRSAIVSVGNKQFSGVEYSLDVVSGPYYDFHLNSSGDDLHSTSHVELNKWHHVVGVNNGATSTIYIDGVAENSAAYSTSLPEYSNAASIGYSSGGFGFNSDALIDDVRIYDRALSTSEVKRLYDLGATTHVNTAINTNPNITSGLIRQYTFDGSLANTVADSVGGSDGYFSSTVATSSVVAPGKIGQGIDLNGSGEYVTLPNYNPSGPHSLAAWIYPRDVSSRQGIFGRLRDCCSNNYGWGLLINGGDLIGMAASNNADWNSNLIAPITADRWHHVVVTFSNCCGMTATGTLYIDGEKKVAYATTTNYYYGYPFEIGAANDALYFNGKIDDARLYSKELTAAEVKRLYDLGR